MVFTKQRQCARQAAAGFQRAVVEVRLGKRCVCANLFGDVHEEVPLIIRECSPRDSFLSTKPVLESLSGQIGKWREFRLLSRSESHQGNQISESLTGLE